MPLLNIVGVLGMNTTLHHTQYFLSGEHSNTTTGRFSSSRSFLTSMEDALKRVTPIQIKFATATGKQPKFIRQANPVLNENAFYLLLKKLLDKYIKVLPVKNTEETAIVLVSSSQPDDASPRSVHGQHTEKHGQDTDMECVAIAGVGNFSRQQIETMLYLITIRSQCEDGLAFYAWMR